MCACVCVCACARVCACVRECVRVCARAHVRAGRGLCISELQALQSERRMCRWLRGFGAVGGLSIGGQLNGGSVACGGRFPWLGSCQKRSANRPSSLLASGCDCLSSSARPACLARRRCPTRPSSCAASAVCVHPRWKANASYNAEGQSRQRMNIRKEKSVRR